jgi:hypothetical protein
MSRRAVITARRQRDRKAAQERARREWVVGRPLVDHSAPILGGNTFEHQAIVEREVRRRAAMIQAEALLLAIDFALNCCIRQEAFFDMIEHGQEIVMYEDGPQVVALYSTAPPTKATGTIPAL